MTPEGPSAEAEGLRIAAARAGQRDGDEWGDDDDAGAEARAWAALPPRAASSNGSDGDAHGRRRGARAARGRLKQAEPAGPPTTVLPAAARPVRPGQPSPARLRVQRQRRRRRRTLIACTFVTTVCTFVTGVGYVYVHNRLGQINRLDLASLAEDAPGSVMNVLLVGSDRGAALEGTEANTLGPGEASGPGSDAIMILHVDPREQKAAIVSVPRDLSVPIAGTSTPDRVNAAFALGGADQLVATLQAALGVTINHYIQMDFTAFKEIVDAVGGVTMYLPYPVRDPVSGLALDGSGCVELDGDQSLSWMRSRQMEFLVNGAWQSDGRGDLGRIERQQDLVRRMMKAALGVGITDPIQLKRLIDVGVRDVTLDSALSTEDMRALGRRFSSLEPDEVVLNTLPTVPVDILGKSVLSLQVAQAQPMLDLLNGRAPVAVTSTTVAGAPATTPGATAATGNTAAGPLKASDVKVRVLNGVGTPGAAAKAATSLTSLGFTVSDKGDAPSIAGKTTITYGSGQLAKAQLLQSSLLTSAVLREDATLKAVDVNLVLGGDYTGVKSGISSGTSSAGTTVAPTTTVAQANPAALPGAVTAPPC